MVRAIVSEPSELSVVHCFLGREGTAEGSESTEKNQIDLPEGRLSREIVRRWHRYPQMKNWALRLAMLQAKLLRMIPFGGDRTCPMLEVFPTHGPDNVKYPLESSWAKFLSSVLICGHLWTILLRYNRTRRTNRRSIGSGLQPSNIVLY